MSASVSTISGLRNGYNNGASSLDFADLLRLDISTLLNTEQQTELGQFFTSAAVASFMADMFEASVPSLHLLDAGAGVGSLSAAFVAEMCGREARPGSMEITSYEADAHLLPYLGRTLEVCRDQCRRAGVGFKSHIVHGDFIQAGVKLLDRGLFSSEHALFDAAILNPPYRKLRTDSDWRRALSTVGIETSNLYTAFLWLSMRLLKPGGEMVAITPRSFCNGPYFKPFRVALADTMRFRRFHIFESRVEAFRDNEVLQENVITHAVKETGAADTDSLVVVSSSMGPSNDGATSRIVAASCIIHPGDRDVFINLVADDWGQRVADQMAALSASLQALGLSVSTGRVVDFRSKEYLRLEPGGRAGEAVAPLIYPLHFGDLFVIWPKEGGRKANALAVTNETRAQLNETGFYVLVKRFTSKEQTRRIVAAVYDPDQVRQNGRPAAQVAFENHLNYFHESGHGLSPELAAGLATFLNSTVVDVFFRQFNGHTQVNASDLRNLRYPARRALEALGRHVLETYGGVAPKQSEIDALITQELAPMAEGENTIDPIKTKTRIEESLQVLKALQFDRQQQNERSALTLLALLNLTPKKAWRAAQNPLIGITPMMDFFREHYGKNYAPNTRETVRRQTVHQFMQGGLIVPNPDDPERPVNSAKTVYQVTPEALDLMRRFGTKEWERSLGGFTALQDVIRARSLRDRTFHRIPVLAPDGETFSLSPGGQNLLIKEIIEEFCQRFAPGGKVLYLGDADEKWASYHCSTLAGLGVEVDEHGKMHDVVIHYTEKSWLVLVEAVTSHGPVDLKRHIELKQRFSNSTVGLVFVTAFLDRAAMGKYLRDIAWETEVWVADAPDHLIHFNGERFLGPYEG